MSVLGNRILKVNHAGEHGAVHIYAGQIRIAKRFHPQMVAELEEFKSHEEEHRRIFENVLQQRKVARCTSYHVCGAGGYALGLLSGVLGAQAVFATTVAVERTVLAHLHQQVAQLKHDPQAVDAIEHIISDEQHHHDQAAGQLQSAQAWWVGGLMRVVRWSTESVIWLGMKL